VSTAPFTRLRQATAQLPLDDTRAWRDGVRARLGQGARVVTLFGRPDEAEVLLTAVLQDTRGELEVLRTRVTPAHGYHTLTRDHPALHCFERELHEQHGVRIADHPWLKPIRYEGTHSGAIKDYPFYKIDGKEVHEVAVGPIHAGIIEPGSFRFMCLGETVHHLEIQLGYQHRGVETLLLQRDPKSLTPLVETIAGDTSIAHAWAHCAAIEALTDCEVTDEIDAARGVGLELERIAMHLAGLAGLANDIGFLQGASTYGRLRTTAINTSMRLCGSRFGRGWLRPGASRATMDAELSKLVRSNLILLKRDLAIINDCFLSSATVKQRFGGVGRVTRTQAEELGLVGMAARASGVSIDQRAFGGGLFKRFPMSVVVEEHGDCWARVLLRVHEMDRSLDWIGQILDQHGAFVSAAQPLGELGRGQLVVSLCEGWRGEVVHCLETDGSGRLIHYKVQDPSLRNWFGLALALRENEISDFPICNKSFDLSYCGNDL
jgi:Ni,Fe-hydrogenase III large subunit